MGFGDCGLGVVALEEEVVEEGDGGGVDLGYAGEDGDVEVGGVVGAVVHEGQVAGDVGVFDKPDVPGVGLELGEDGVFSSVEVEVVEVGED